MSIDRLGYIAYSILYNVVHVAQDVDILSVYFKMGIKCNK